MPRINIPSKYPDLRAFPFVFLILCLFFSVNPAFSSQNDDMAQYQNRLETLQKSIAKIQKHLKGNKKQRSHVVTELKTLESKISKTSKKLKSLKKEIRRSHKQQKKLEHELAQLNRQLHNQRAALSEQMRAAYSMGNQQSLKMLLNQQDPAQAGRTQEYFNYLNRARNQQITSFITTIEQTKETETALEQTLLTQNSLLKTQKEKKKLRQKQRTKRQRLISELSDKIQNQESTLDSLETSRNKIEGLLKSLGELLADIPTSPTENKPFASLKGKLPWPAKGPFLSQFGQAKNQGDLKWNGILIKADYGTPVKVISHGRIAFSDWLQGFGFITIVDHADGYMSLYGHSESLFKQTGDWVRAGEAIATAGDSGGQPQSGIYFEIRSRGKPVNPSKWCTLSARHASN